MPETSRRGDIGSGHGCFPPTPAVGASGDVFINSIGALRKGDALAPHGCSDCPPHGRSVSGGSPTVFVNGRALARVGDGIDCGGSMAAGSADVFADELDPVRNIGGAARFAKTPCTRGCIREARRRGQAFVGS